MGAGLTVDLALLVVEIFNRRHKNASLVRQQHAIWHLVVVEEMGAPLGETAFQRRRDKKLDSEESPTHQIAVAREKDSVEHGFVQEGVAHPFTNDDIHLFHRQNNVLHLDVVGEEGDEKDCGKEMGPAGRTSFTVAPCP